MTIREMLPFLLLVAVSLYESSIGILLAPPGDTAGGRILVQLLPGRSYVLLCTLRDKPDAQPHINLGMISAFQVTAR